MWYFIDIFGEKLSLKHGKKLSSLLIRQHVHRTVLDNFDNFLQVKGM